MKKNVAFIGLGVMGYPMAGHLAKHHNVTVYNRTKKKAEQWAKEHNGKCADTPKEAAQDAEFVFACVGNDNDLREITIGKDGAFGSIKNGAVFVDNTTASANVARELAKIANDSGFDFLDAPVSGGEAGAINGALTVMVGGNKKTFEQAKPVIEAYAQKVGLMGDVGAGQLTKMMNQICIAGIVQGLAEAIHLGKAAGLDINAVVDVISKGAAGSWQMVNRHETMNKGEYNHGFAVDWMRKDLAICLEEAKAQGVTLPLTALVDQFYGDVQRMGGNRWDTSSLLQRLSVGMSADR